MVKSVKMRRDGHIAHTRKIINSYKILCVRPESKGATWETKA